MKSLIILFILSFTISGCNGVVTDFVKGVRPPLTIESPSTSDTSDGARVKISPGKVTSAGGGIGMSATVTPTNRTMTSSDLSAVVTISRSSTQ